MWWDEPLGYEDPEDLDESIEGLETIPMLNELSVDIGLLVGSSTKDATIQLLELPATTIPRDLKHLALLNVNLAFLERVAQGFAAVERRDIFGQLMAALPKVRFVRNHHVRTPNQGDAGGSRRHCIELDGDGCELQNDLGERRGL